MLAFLSAGCALQPTVDGLPVERPDLLSPHDGAIAIVGDLQMTPSAVTRIMRRENNSTEQRFLVSEIATRIDELAGLVVVGDLVFSGGSRSDWAHFDEIIAPIAARVPILPAIGNHDYRCVFVKVCTHRSVPKNFTNRFPWFAPGMPYDVGFGETVLVFIDSETGLEQQGVWLRSRLEELERRYRAIVVFTHRPPYTDAATVDVGPDAELQAHIVEPLSQSSLPWLFFSGHAHGYEHLNVDGRHFVVSAGGGGPRGSLKQNRPNDVYSGRVCPGDENDTVLRPYNYQLLRFDGQSLRVEVYGFCRGDTQAVLLEEFAIAVP